MPTGRNPFVGPPPEEIQLSNAPLERVLVQVQFPLISSIEQQNFVAGFQESIRRPYPILHREAQSAFRLAPMDTNVESQTIWRFSDGTGSWRVSLASDFIALETRSYQSRADLLERLGEVLRALDETISPGYVERIGVRYIDRVPIEHLGEIEELVNPFVAGVLASDVRGSLKHEYCEHIFNLPDGGGLLGARWGVVPAKATFDPQVFQALEQDSWFLDIDVFQQGQRAFDARELAALVQVDAEMGYRFFRWAVTEQFLARFRGDA